MIKETLIHIIPKEKFTQGVIELINLTFGCQQHKFYIIETSYANMMFPEYDNVVLLTPNKHREFYDDLKNCRGILVHFFLTRITSRLFWNRRHLLKKACWIPWGADIYDYERKNKTILGKLTILYKRMFTSKFKWVATLVPGDYDKAKDYYKVKGDYLPVRYCYLDTTEITLRVAKMHLRRGINQDITRVIVGNSASKSCLHLSVFDELRKFSDEKMEIYVPLSYGDPVYAEEVIAYGNSLFGDRFHAIMDFMDAEEYRKFLSTMDVGVFANKRQQAMGNIGGLLAFGCKVYLYPGTSMYDFYKDAGFICFDYTEIGQKSFSEFIMFEEEDKRHNNVCYKQTYSMKDTVTLWDDLFKTMQH